MSGTSVSWSQLGRWVPSQNCISSRAFSHVTVRAVGEFAVGAEVGLAAIRLGVMRDRGEFLGTGVALDECRGCACWRRLRRGQNTIAAGQQQAQYKPEVGHHAPQ